MSMMVWQLAFVLLHLFVIPVFVGTIFGTVDKGLRNLPFWWISGQMLLWGGFEIIAVPMILQQEQFSKVVSLFRGYTLFWMVSAIVVGILSLKKRRQNRIVSVKNELGRAQKIESIVCWLLFWGILAYQLVQAVVMTYADGDDAYYVAVATLAEESDTMYRKMPYSGGLEPLKPRYGLAPFPIWIAYLARISGIKTVSVAHVFLPLALIPMTYGIYYMLANKIFKNKRVYIPVFLLFAELLVLFGDVSFQTAENFMIARSRQGKAALANIMIPMLFYILFLIMERLEEKQRIIIREWLLLCVVLTATCLCSSLGILLVVMLVAIAGICAAFVYHRWKFLFPLAFCCAPCVGIAILYIVL